MPQLDESKMRLVQELEIEMMTDMYAKLTAACHKKVTTNNWKVKTLEFSVYRPQVPRAGPAEGRGCLYRQVCRQVPRDPREDR